VLTSSALAGGENRIDGITIFDLFFDWLEAINGNSKNRKG